MANEEMVGTKKEWEYLQSVLKECNAEAFLDYIRAHSMHVDDNDDVWGEKDT